MISLLHRSGLMRAVLIDPGEGEDPRFILPLETGEAQGLQWRCLRPGRQLERPTVNIAWNVVIDDRALCAGGPDSFDRGTLTWLFKDAHRVVVDAAEPHQGLYELIVEEGIERRLKQLIDQTVESRRLDWRQFTRANSDVYGVLEIIPGSGQRQVVPSVTRFEGRTPAA